MVSDPPLFYSMIANIANNRQNVNYLSHPSLHGGTGCDKIIKTIPFVIVILMQKRIDYEHVRIKYYHTGLSGKQFLRACIESILSQDFQEYELLLIDDGSDDGGEQICDEYAGKDARIFTFHQKNQGVSADRNLGLCHARGEYICFVDADDSLEHTLLSQCMAAVKETSADLLHHGMTEHLWRNGTIINYERIVTNGDLQN